MTGNFKQLGAAVAAMFATKSEEEQAAQARAERLPLIEEARSLFTPEMLAAIARDEMPEGFVVDRPSYVAMAQLASRALSLVDAAVAAIPTPERGTQH